MSPLFTLLSMAKQRCFSFDALYDEAKSAQTPEQMKLYMGQRLGGISYETIHELWKTLAKRGSPTQARYLSEVFEDSEVI